MKKILPFILSLGLLFGLATSCGVSSGASKIGDGFGYMKLEVYHVISPSEAVCVRNKGKEKVEYYKVNSTEKAFYTGQKISGWWIYVDTYKVRLQYEGLRTIPVIMTQDEYEKKKGK